MTYPIMLLYTAIECPSASWAKFTWDPPEQTDRQTNMTENITFLHYIVGGNKKAFFLRHTTHLPSSTSQLVWSGPCLGRGGSSSTTTSGGVLFHHHFWGGSSYSTTSRGVLFHHHFQWGPLPLPLLGGSSSATTSGGFPCDLSHNAVIYCYRMPQCIMGKIYMGSPPTDRLTDKHN